MCAIEYDGTAQCAAPSGSVLQRETKGSSGMLMA
jgi:hypothetical protein